MKFQAIFLAACLAMIDSTAHSLEHVEQRGPSQVPEESQQINAKTAGLRGSSQRRVQNSISTPPVVRRLGSGSNSSPAVNTRQATSDDGEKEDMTPSSRNTRSNSSPVFQWPDQPRGPNTPGTPLCPSRCKYYFFSIRDVCARCD